MAPTPPDDPGQGHLVGHLFARAVLATGDRDTLALITAEAVRAGVIDRLVFHLASVAAEHLPADGLMGMASAHLDALAADDGPSQ